MRAEIRDAVVAVLIITTRRPVRICCAVFAGVKEWCPDKVGEG
jgi:hypothetical protein